MASSASQGAAVHTDALEQAQMDAVLNASDIEAHRMTQLDAPDFVSDAWQSKVREPTRDDVSCWTTVADVATWAKPHLAALYDLGPSFGCWPATMTHRSSRSLNLLLYRLHTSKHNSSSGGTPGNLRLLRV